MTKFLLTNLQQKPLKSYRNVLSVNNSLLGTYTDVASGRWTADKILSGIAEELGHSIAWTRRDRLGEPLLTHWRDGVSAPGTTPTTARDLIRTGIYTDIVLQEFSDYPAVNVPTFLESARLFAQEIRAYSPNSRLHLVLNYPYSTDSNYAATMAAIEASTQFVASDIGAGIIPIGRTWNTVRMNEGFGTFNPYFDDRHPTLIGVYWNGLTLARYFLGLTTLPRYSPAELSSSKTIGFNRSGEAVPRPCDTFDFTGVTTAEGQSLGAFRGQTLQLFLSNISWSADGTTQITTAEPSATLADNTYGHPGYQIMSPVVYQVGGNKYQVKTATAQVPNTFVGLDDTKEIFIAVNDIDYSNNTGGFRVNYRS